MANRFSNCKVLIRKILLTLVCLGLTAAASGCVGKASTNMDMEAKVVTIPAGKALLYVIRDEGGAWWGKGLPVFLNNIEIGRMGNNQFVYAVVDSGMYLLTPFKGDPVKAVFKPGNIYYFRMKIMNRMSDDTQASILMHLSEEEGRLSLIERRLSSKSYSKLSILPLNTDSLCTLLSQLKPGMTVAQCSAIVDSSLELLSTKKSWLLSAIKDAASETIRSTIMSSDRLLLPADDEVAIALRKAKTQLELAENMPKEELYETQLKKAQEELDKLGNYSIYTLKGPFRLGIHLVFLRSGENKTGNVFISAKNDFCGN
ncbi:MAG: hypothetical protein ABIJ45_11880 [Candidatus Zixiibacteriota bacterium]